jgi:hypothetical protein
MSRRLLAIRTSTGFARTRGMRYTGAALLLPLFLLVSATVGCTPKAPPLRGTLAPARLPDAELPPVHRRLVFRWSYSDNDFRMRGEGVARVAPPDSVRLDLFVNGGLGGGRALLIDDELRTEGEDKVKRLLPPVPLLWASLGRLKVPAASDTVARVDADTLRVDIGVDPRWRTTFLGTQLRRLELIENQRVPQWVSRDSVGNVSYQHTRAHRKLEITITRVDTVPGFDATIWH